MEPPNPADDPRMRAGMEGLIAVVKDRRPPSAREEPSGRDPSEGVPRRGGMGALEQGAVVGRYVVIKKLGAGAMGVVYAAYDPELDRKVALKLLLPGVGGDERRERLRREAQALGKLAHPHIVAVHDVGTVGEQVWLAMEFVQGRTLGAWLAQAPRGWQEVVRVMRSAGKGLAAAHAAGLLHRDFKPENAMVGDDGRVRVMDFGLARVGAEGAPSEADPSQPPPTVETLAMELTEPGATIGTPAYMAPEQFDHAELTAAADQFAFCVSLWEALYGKRPFRGRTFAELEANVLAGRRSPAPKDRAVPNRLRLACERGLSIDPQQRWPSMEALVAELGRVAAPRTRRWLALGVTGGLAALGGGLALARYVEVMDRCTGARAQLDGIWDDAQRQQVKAAILGTELVYAPGTWERVEPRLDAYADAWTSKHAEVCEATRVTAEQTEAVMELRMGCLREHRTALHAAVKVLAAADEEVVEKAVGMVAGLPLLTRCEDVERLEQQRQRVPPPEDPQVAQQVEALREQLADIDAEEAAGKYAHALQEVEPRVQQAEALGYGPLWAEAQLRRGRLLGRNGRYGEAEQALQASYALAVAHAHDDVALEAARVLTYVVGADQARPAEGLVWGRTALPLAERHGEGLEVAAISNNLANVLDTQGKYEDASLHHQRALRIRETVLGVDHPLVAASVNNLANVLDTQGEYEQAALHHRRALQIHETALGVDHPLVAASANNLGVALASRGENEQAALHHRRAQRIWEQTLGPDHPHVASSSTGLAVVAINTGEYEQAELHLQRAMQIREKALGAHHPDLATNANDLAAVYFRQGKYEQAALRFGQALQVFEKALGPDHPHVAASLNNLANVLEMQGEHEQAKLHYQRALEIREKALGADHPLVASARMGLASVALAQQQLAAARAHAERAVAIHEAQTVAPEQLAKARFLLAQALWSDHAERARARALAEQAHAALVEAGKAGETDLAAVQAWLTEHRVR